ncbi:MAG: hypothetical protein ABIP78_12835, partial [Pyrinomonadaceae bacterium]
MQKLVTTLILIVLSSFSATAHGDGSHDESRQDVVVKVIKANGNVFMLQGRGGNIGAIVGADGILIVDDDYKAVSEKLRDALKELGA